MDGRTYVEIVDRINEARSLSDLEWMAAQYRVLYGGDAEWRDVAETIAMMHATLRGVESVSGVEPGQRATRSCP